MDSQNFEILGHLLQIIRQNIEGNKNYEIDRLLLNQINQLDISAQNIFWHDIAMYYMKLNSDKYIKCLENIQKNNDRGYSNAQHILGQKYLKKKELDKAIQALNEISKDYCDIYLNSRIDLGRALEERRQDEQAIKVYIEILKITTKSDEEYAKAQLNLSSLYFNKKMYSQAEKALKKISGKFKSIYADSQFGLALIASKRKNDQTAVDYYEKVSKEQNAQTYAKSKFNQGNSYLRLGNTGLAIESFNQVPVEFIELYEMAQNNLISIYRNKFKISEILETLTNIRKESKVYALLRYSITVLKKVENSAHKEL